MTVLHVSCAAEPGYVPHCAAMLHSLLASRGDGEIQVHFLHGPGFPGHDAGRLSRMVERNGGSIDFAEIADDAVEGLPGDISKEVWYRTFLPELLPALDRVLYLDADLIVLRALDRLFELDLTGHWVGAVTNVLQHNHRHRPMELGLPGEDSYFNAGVLLVNLEATRRDGWGELVRAAGREHGARFEWGEQDAMNVTVGERRLALHPRWNATNALMHFPQAAEVFPADELEEARRHPAIRHFEGPRENKPWHYMCERAMRELYFEHRRRTPWPDWELEARTPANVARRTLRRVRRPRAGTR